MRDERDVDGAPAGQQTENGRNEKQMIETVDASEIVLDDGNMAKWIRKEDGSLEVKWTPYAAWFYRRELSDVTKNEEEIKEWEKEFDRLVDEAIKKWEEKGYEVEFDEDGDAYIEIEGERKYIYKKEYINTTGVKSVVRILYFWE